ncbi:protein THEMIS2-like isoform X2 [Myxocyprinus asiaticus]|uniref:protein THEMIS2-like isoform X2 n=1 Tax=Myxocyprinus asiaticus TaxID=70543 RepID=UPI002222C7B3|nr:protein THEMIS2-like isoform X2 [Myxocyprinus asiaticus]
MGDLQSLRVFINGLDQKSLPRILQVCSGVYFQGSVYELSGSEVCLSTGDLMKIISLELLSVSCEEIDTGTSFELPIEYSGQFQLIAEDLPYNTIKELVCLCPVGVDACGSFTFISSNELTVDNFTLPAGKQLTLLSVELDEDGARQARCQLVGQNMASAEILLPLSLKGEFYECIDDHGYSLQEIISSPRLSSRCFRSTSVKKSGSPLVFSPVYEIQAIMHMRKDVVKFPSSLEVDVQDMTDQFQDLVFITPLSLAEVARQQKELFPTIAEILDGPEGNQFFNCSWFQELQKGRHLVLHGWGETPMVLASTPKGRKGKQYFLISQGYGGRMRRRAREFGSVYELYLASSQSPGLKVSVTRDCEGVEEEGMPALSVGEHLEVLGMASKDESGAAQKVESLICKQTMEVEDEDDEDDEDGGKELALPLFMGGHFVEKLSDNKKYSLTDLMNSSLPLDIKVVTRDKELEKDPLMGLPALKLEETFIETTVLTSLPNNPDWCFELPVRWLQMSLCFTSDHLPWSIGEPPELHVETVIEVTENFYYEYHKLTSKAEEPPPRPPKRKPSASEAPKKSPKSRSFKSLPNIMTQQLNDLSLGQTKARRPPAPPPPDDTPEQPHPLLPRKKLSRAESTSQPNMYVKSPIMAQKSVIAQNLRANAVFTCCQNQCCRTWKLHTNASLKFKEALRL